MSETYTPSVAEIVMGKTHLGDNFWRELSEAEVRRGIEAIRAEAWDEGERAGGQNQLNWDGWRDTKPPIENPYRKEQTND